MENKTYRLPKEFLERLEILYPSESTNLCRSFNAEFKTTFRCNALKADARTLIELLRKERIQAKRFHFPDLAFQLEAPRLADVEKNDLYKNGFIYVQNVSSMLPPVLLLLQAGKPIQTGEKILDLCAAPGGKTTLLASLSHGKNPITAIEQDSVRFQILLSNIKRQGCENIIQAINADGTELWKEYESAFDRILVDAPCSAEAGFKARNARTFAYWSLRRVKDCAYIQKKLLASAWRCLKPGGFLSYSTCTFAPEENEEVVQWLMEKFPGEVTLLPLQIPLKNARNGLLSWKEKLFSSTLIHTKRILPTECMEGFYIALLKKTAP